MSIYTGIKTEQEYEHCSAEVGWDHDLGYWFHVTGPDGRRVISGGLDASDEPEELKHLISLFDLVEASAGVIDWSREDLVLRRLRDDPWSEQAQLVPRHTPAAKLLSHTFGPAA
jgi:hypothetical protein